MTKRFLIVVQQELTIPHQTRVTENEGNRWVRQFVRIKTHLGSIQDDRDQRHQNIVCDPCQRTVCSIYVKNSLGQRTEARGVPCVTGILNYPSMSFIKATRFVRSVVLPPTVMYSTGETSGRSGVGTKPDPSNIIYVSPASSQSRNESAGS